MKFSLVIVTSPDESRACSRALHFAVALRASGHELIQVFFYARSASLGLPHHDHLGWQGLTQDTAAELILCSASAEHFGVESAPKSFTIAGLGAMFEAGLYADRVVTFG
ncbi:DsrE family protein [Flavobacteriaceae bacterium]|nr:DsrE family protein [Flavobacteriaceae bacterium]